MKFQLTRSQLMTRRAVREFVRKEVTPLAAELDQRNEFPAAGYQQALGLEVLELTLPEVLGGIGDDFVGFIIALEEFACGSAALAHCIAATEAMVHLLVRHGNRQQQEQYLPGLLAGEIFGATAIWNPETETGSTASVQATADGDGFRLSGSLPYVPFAPAADLAVISAPAGKDVICAFVLDRQMPGFSVETAEMMGMKGFPMGRLQLKDVQVTDDCLLGTKALGKHINEALRVRSEVSTGAIAVGLSQAALEAAALHSKARIQFGKPLAEMEATQNKIADMAAGIRSARLLVYEASSSLEQSKSSARLAAMAKVMASELAVDICREAVQIHGGYGYVKDYPVERFYRDALFSQVFPTANKAQRRTIAQHVFRKTR